MSGFNGAEVERFEGVHIPTGKPVRPKRVWGGHRFTDEECQKLLNGEEITFTALTKNNSEFEATGSLGESEFNGHSYWGFQLNTHAFPREWCKHVFTDDEKTMLENGERCHISGCESKSGKTFDVDVTWEETESGYKIVPHFND